MKNKLKYFILSIFSLLLVAIFGSERAMAVELDTVWVSDINGQVLFQHPVTKNILVSANGGITELNSQDGKLVRSFPFDFANSDLSPDGTKILNSEMNTKIYNFSEELPFYTIENSMHSKFLGNNYIVYKTLKSNGNKIAKINLETKETVITPVNGGITAIATSPDGKYISYATYEENNGSDSKVYLYLLDAETMKEITELGNWDSEGQRIESIHFSPDSKYFTYNTASLYTELPLNIYNVETKKIIRTIDKNTIDYYNYSGCHITLVGNNQYFVKLINQDLSIRDVDFYLKNIETNKVIFQNKYDTYNNILDISNNYLFCNFVKLNPSFCFDLNKIISGIPDVNPFLIIYKNRKLFIDNNNKPINNISILTIEGREVYRQNFNRLLNTNNTIEIPIELSNGLYLINITSGKESFTEKLLVIE